MLVLRDPSAKGSPRSKRSNAFSSSLPRRGSARRPRGRGDELLRVRGELGPLAAHLAPRRRAVPGPTPRGPQRPPPRARATAPSTLRRATIREPTSRPANGSLPEARAAAVRAASSASSSPPPRPSGSARTGARARAAPSRTRRAPSTPRTARPDVFSRSPRPRRVLLRRRNDRRRLLLRAPPGRARTRRRPPPPPRRPRATPPPRSPSPSRRTPCPSRARRRAIASRWRSAAASSPGPARPLARAEEGPVRKLGERLGARSVAAPERLRRRAPPVPAEALSGRHPERRGVQALAGPALRLRRAVRAGRMRESLRPPPRRIGGNRATRQSRQVHPGARLLRLGAERRVG